MPVKAEEHCVIVTLVDGTEYRQRKFAGKRPLYQVERAVMHLLELVDALRSRIIALEVERDQLKAACHKNKAKARKTYERVAAPQIKGQKRQIDQLGAVLDTIESLAKDRGMGLKISAAA
ncbi:MAG: hypothetical protein L0Z53_21475 [Acidobacteriales bacterium]|nr:hypothetical protein [Terriglobales bacterium]